MGALLPSARVYGEIEQIDRVERASAVFDVGEASDRASAEAVLFALLDSR
jgi:hypothetical protein